MGRAYLERPRIRDRLRGRPRCQGHQPLCRWLRLLAAPQRGGAPRMAARGGDRRGRRQRAQLPAVVSGCLRARRQRQRHAGRRRVQRTGANYGLDRGRWRRLALAVTDHRTAVVASTRERRAPGPAMAPSAGRASRLRTPPGWWRCLWPALPSDSNQPDREMAGPASVDDLGSPGLGQSIRVRSRECQPGPRRLTRAGRRAAARRLRAQ